MGKRIGIAEAPDATLGEAGVQQLIPILEVGNLTERTPKKTSISAMAAFFGGGGTRIPPQIQRFEQTLGSFIEIDMPNATLVGGSTLSTKINMTKKDSSPIAGDENYYLEEDNNIVFSVAGTYRIKGAFYAQTVVEFLAGAVAGQNINSPSFVKIITTGDGINGRTFTGAIQPPNTGSRTYTVEYCLFDDYITIATAGDSLQFNAQIFNQGNVQTFGTNAWSFSNLITGSNSSVTVENIR